MLLHAAAAAAAQLPSFDDLWFVSLLGALMSVTYSTIAVVMSATVHRSPDINYNPSAVQQPILHKVMGIFNALTTIFFAYGELAVSRHCQNS